MDTRRREDLPAARVDPLAGRLDELVSALTTVTATASSDRISVRVRADGSVEQLSIDDRALDAGGAALADSISDVLGRAHAELRRRLRAAEEALCADPRIAEATAVVAAALDKPLPSPPVVRGPEVDDYVRPVSYLVPAGDDRRR